MKRPYLTVLQYSMLSHLVTGIGFLLLGLLDFVSGSAIVGLLVAALMGILFIITAFGKREGMDEMARSHRNDAYGDGFMAMMLAMVILELLDHSGTASIKLTTATCICFGAGFTAIGLRFRKLEKDGDDE